MLFKYNRLQINKYKKIKINNIRNKQRLGVIKQRPSGLREEKDQKGFNFKSNES